MSFRIVKESQEFHVNTNVSTINQIELLSRGSLKACQILPYYSLDIVCIVKIECLKLEVDFALGSYCFKCAVNDTLTNDDFNETLWCNLWLNKKVNLCIGVVYRPPSSPQTKNDYLILNLFKKTSNLNCSYKIVIVDFNLPFNFSVGHNV